MAMALKAQPSDELSDLVRQRQVVLVTGKGGVGKSTVAAAIAQLLARQRGGAVAVESAAHPRLPQLLDPALPIELDNIDLEQALPRFLSRLARLPAIFNALLSNRVIRLFLRTAPAVAELILLDELRQIVEAQRERGIPVVVDLPATGHALALLGTPGAARRLVRVGPVARLAENLEQLFLDRQRCELLVVALPEELPVNETIELVQKASMVGLHCQTVVVNQVPRAPVEDSERSWLDQVQQADSPLGRAASAARDALVGVDEARQQIARLHQAIDGTIVELPATHDPDPRQRVQRLVDALVT